MRKSGWMAVLALALAGLLWGCRSLPEQMAGKFSVHKVYGDHMVLQRQKPVRISGHAAPGEAVKVAIAPETGSAKEIAAYATADAQGEWEAVLPEMEAGGLTPLGKAMELALQKIEEQKCLYDSCGITSKRPWIFLISDGEPTDYDWEIIAEKCRYAQKNKKVVIHAVGTQGANLEKLAKFSTISPKRLTGLKFTEFFLWLSRSVSCVSKAAPNVPDLLEDTGDWNDEENL